MYLKLGEENSEIYTPKDQVMKESHELRKKFNEVLFILNKDDSMFGYVRPFRSSPDNFSTKLEDGENVKIDHEYLGGMDYESSCTDIDNPMTYDHKYDLIPDPRHYNAKVVELTKRIKAGSIKGPIIFTGNGDPEGRFVPSKKQVEELVDAAKEFEIPIYFIYLDDPAIDDRVAGGVYQELSYTQDEIDKYKDQYGWYDYNGIIPKRNRLKVQLSRTKRTHGKPSAYSQDTNNEIFGGMRAKNIWPSNKNHRIYRYRQMCEQTGGKLIRVVGYSDPTEQDEDKLGPDGGFYTRLDKAVKTVYSEIMNFYSSPAKRADAKKIRTDIDGDLRIDKDQNTNNKTDIDADDSYVGQLFDHYDLEFASKKISEIEDIELFIDGVFAKTIVSEYALLKKRTERDENRELMPSEKMQITDEMVDALEDFSEMREKFLEEYSKIDENKFSRLQRAVVAYKNSAAYMGISPIASNDKDGVDMCKDGIKNREFDCDIASFSFVQLAMEVGIDVDAVVCSRAQKYDHMVVSVYGEDGQVENYVEAIDVLVNDESGEDLAFDNEIIMSIEQFGLNYGENARAYTVNWGTHYDIEYTDFSSQIDSGRYLEGQINIEEETIGNKVRGGQISTDGELNFEKNKYQKEIFLRGTREFGSGWIGNKDDFLSYLRYVRFLQGAEMRLDRISVDVDRKLGQVVDEGKKIFPEFILKRHLPEY